MSETDASKTRPEDLYDLLGVEPDASLERITRAYRRQVRRYHPDVDASSEAAEQFARISEALRVLSDPQARARYDATRTGSRRAARRGASGHSGWSPWAGNRPVVGSMSGEAFWIGGRGRPNPFDQAPPSATPPKQPEEVELELSIAEAYRGASRTVTVTSHDAVNSVDVTIPAGVIDGQLIEVALPHLPGSDTSPVFLRVRLTPHERYRVDGRDVHLELALSPWEAVLGSVVTVDAPAGPIAIDVPAGTSTGDVLALPGHGLPNPAGVRGDLYAHAGIAVPARLTAAERDLFERLASTSTFDPRASTPPPR